MLTLWASNNYERRHKIIYQMGEMTRNAFEDFVRSSDTVTVALNALDHQSTLYTDWSFMTCFYGKHLHSFRLIRSPDSKPESTNSAASEFPNYISLACQYAVQYSYNVCTCYANAAERGFLYVFEKVGRHSRKINIRGWFPNYAVAAGERWLKPLECMNWWLEMFSMGVN